VFQIAPGDFLPSNNGPFIDDLDRGKSLTSPTNLLKVWLQISKHHSRSPRPFLFDSLSVLSQIFRQDPQGRRSLLLPNPTTNGEQLRILYYPTFWRLLALNLALSLLPPDSGMPLKIIFHMSALEHVSRPFECGLRAY
jgi:hypothetical protein